MPSQRRRLYFRPFLRHESTLDRRAQQPVEQTLALRGVDPAHYPALRLRAALSSRAHVAVWTLTVSEPN